MMNCADCGKETADGSGLCISCTQLRLKKKAGVNVVNCEDYTI
jgi:hypothetical protein